MLPRRLVPLTLLLLPREPHLLLPPLLPLPLLPLPPLPRSPPLLLLRLAPLPRAPFPLRNEPRVLRRVVLRVRSALALGVRVLGAAPLGAKGELARAARRLGLVGRVRMRLLVRVLVLVRGGARVRVRVRVRVCVSVSGRLARELLVLELLLDALAALTLGGDGLLAGVLGGRIVLMGGGVGVGVRMGGSGSVAVCVRGGGLGVRVRGRGGVVGEEEVVVRRAVRVAVGRLVCASRGVLGRGRRSRRDVVRGGVRGAVPGCRRVAVEVVDRLRVGRVPRQLLVVGALLVRRCVSVKLSCVMPMPGRGAVSGRPGRRARVVTLDRRRRVRARTTLVPLERRLVLLEEAVMTGLMLGELVLVLGEAGRVVVSVLGRRRVLEARRVTSICE